MRRLRDALAVAFGAVNADTSRPQSMARQFELDKSLSWRISKVLTEPDPLACIPHLPRKSGLEILLRTLKSAGVDDATLDAAREAIREFEEMVERHAGDRDTLNMMLGHVNPQVAEQRAEAYRKLSFQGNSATWGVRAGVQMSAQFMAPSETPGMLDFATVAGLLDFWRLRGNVPWPMAWLRNYGDDDGTPLPADAPLPLDPDVGPRDAPILPTFCSNPPPNLGITKDTTGVVRYELRGGPIGSTAAVSCMAGWHSKSGAGMYRDERNRFGELLVRLNTPAECLYFDFFVHRSLVFALNPDAFVYSQLPSEPGYPSGGRERGLLPFTEEVIDLGSPPHMVTADIPRYREMFEFVCGRCGWRANEFHGFRLKLRYPPMPAVALFRFELPEQP